MTKMGLLLDEMSGGSGMQESRTTDPRRMTSLRTATELSFTGQLIANALCLNPPSTRDPGYWKTEDGFIAINSGLLKSSYRNLTHELKALITFEADGAKRATQLRIRAEVDSQVDDEKEQFYHRLRIAREERKRCVIGILKHLARFGIRVPIDTMTVHRVSYSFFLKLDLRTLRRLCKLKARGYRGLRRIRIDTLYAQ
ncbi:hypothetical protein ACFL6C_07455 [Myxococcota bacterium]